jgi:hypothetical protein
MWKTETLPIKSGMHQGCLLSSFFLKSVFAFLVRPVSQEKNKKDTNIKEVKPFLMAGIMKILNMPLDNPCI